jgi:hypothetical protein
MERALRVNVSWQEKSASRLKFDMQYSWRIHFLTKLEETFLGNFNLGNLF